MRNLRRFGICVCLLLMPIAVAGQSGSAIRGKITDSNGAALKGAEVQLVSRAGGRVSARTDAEGLYVFRDIAPGNYIIEISSPGFAVTTSEPVRVEGGQAVTQDFQLSIASVNENVVVVAAGTPQRADEVSKAVTIVDETQLETRRALTVAEGLRGTPGLRVQQQGSPGALTSLRFRGQRNFDTAVLLDGLRVRDSADINGSSFPFISDFTPRDLDRVEILRGSGSSIYGTNAIGGVINLVPKPGAGRARFDAGFEAGGLGLFRERLQGSGGIGERAGFSFGLSRTDVRKGVDGNDQYGNTSGTGRFQIALTPSIDVAANFYERAPMRVQTIVRSLCPVHLHQRNRFPEQSRVTLFTLTSKIRTRDVATRYG